MHRYGKEKGGKEHQRKQKENIHYLRKQDLKQVSKVSKTLLSLKKKKTPKNSRKKLKVSKSGWKSIQGDQKQAGRAPERNREKVKLLQ